MNRLDLINEKDSIIKLFKLRNSEIRKLNASTLSSGVRLNWLEVRRMKHQIKQINNMIKQKELIIVRILETKYPKPRAILETRKFIEIWENT
jgi:hypothetical protein